MQPQAQPVLPMLPQAQPLMLPQQWMPPQWMAQQSQPVMPLPIALAQAVAPAALQQPAQAVAPAALQQPALASGSHAAAHLFMLQRKALDSESQLRRAERARIARMQEHNEDIYARMQVAHDEAHLARFFGCETVNRMSWSTVPCCILLCLTKSPYLATDRLRAPEDAQSRSALVS